jgi:putative ubiquitin-RnfH superfamily antitoxin RatB of RatAB toxin-antitoxin module
MLLAGVPDNYTVDPMSKDNMITVEVAYALPHKQALLEIEVPVGATVLEAAQQSGVASKFEDVDLENTKFGIFGQVVSPQQVLRDGDRVEVYRPLIADPKEVRKARAVRAKERRQQDKTD